MSRAIFAAALVILAVAITMAAHAAEWALTGALNSHDPSITKEGKTWWVFQTSPVGIGVKSSPDGRAWTKGAPIFPDGLPWWHAYTNNAGGTWAADVHDWNGGALCYYAVSTFGSNHSAIGLMTASSIAASDWVDHGPVLTSSRTDDYNAIDPTFTLDASGAPWLAFGSWWTGIYLTRLDPVSLKPTGSWSHLAAADGGIEGPSLVYQGGYYYLFVSRGTCCAAAASTYHICEGRSRSITGPYLDKAGVSLLDGGRQHLGGRQRRQVYCAGRPVRQRRRDRMARAGQSERVPFPPVRPRSVFFKGWPALEQAPSSPLRSPPRPSRSGRENTPFPPSP